MTNDKIVEAMADYIKEGYISGDAKEIIAEIIATHDSELKKHIKVLVEALVVWHEVVGDNEYPFTVKNSRQALASLPEELRGL